MIEGALKGSSGCRSPVRDPDVRRDSSRGSSGDVAGEAPALLQVIERAKKRCGLSGTVQVVSCYEAGRDGFWLHRWLVEHGVENLVVASSSIEVNRRERRAKSDRLDVAKLYEMLVRYLRGEKRVVASGAGADGARRGRATAPSGARALATGA